KPICSEGERAMLNKAGHTKKTYSLSKDLVERIQIPENSIGQPIRSLLPKEDKCLYRATEKQSRKPIYGSPKSTEIEVTYKSFDTNGDERPDTFYEKEYYVQEDRTVAFLTKDKGTPQQQTWIATSPGKTPVVRIEYQGPKIAFINKNENEDGKVEEYRCSAKETIVELQGMKSVLQEILGQTHEVVGTPRCLILKDTDGDGCFDTGTLEVDFANIE
ncbi:MAG: hypothetical protein AAGJ35_12485, partial [Myxococcota bacterium]